MITVTQTEFLPKLEKVLLNADGEVYSARIVEEDDGTFDIRFWDERLEESCEDIEEGHFTTYEKADARLLEIIEAHEHITFVKVEAK